MTTHRKLPLAIMALAVLAACNTTPPRNVALERARTDYQTAQGDPAVNELAGAELRLASDALDQASQAWTTAASPSEVNHLAYLARQRIAIARELANQRVADAEVTRARAAREQMRLTARTTEADEAHRTATAAQQQADTAGRQAAAAQQQADASALQVLTARQATEAAQASNRALLAQLQDLNAKETARGVVIAIGDVLFDTDASRLKPEGVRAIDKLAAILGQYPARRALVEGYTDSTGSPRHNQLLSGRRADAVKLALIRAGVAPSRVSAQAYGEAHPVASNDSAQGRGLNRRVEVVLSDDSGVITPR